MARRKLELHRETLRDLAPDADRTRGVVGGASILGVLPPCPSNGGGGGGGGVFTGGMSFGGCDELRRRMDPVIKVIDRILGREHKPPPKVKQKTPKTTPRSKGKSDS